ncbi:helix-turn-helix domain-containing protein [Nonomuraea sp. CA-218870]|uniref:helix-turn-helix domain-containing protein n=1 Tax=Nonomuraea sp. CA-218870 TaxID=3239998 RepID=UPI003D91FCA1
MLEHRMSTRAKTVDERRSLAKPAEVAEYLQVKEETLAQWRYRKIGPPWTKAGNAVRYRWPDVESYLDKQAQGGAA